MLERLWAGWRSDYVSSAVAPPPADDGLGVFERILGSGLPDNQTFVVRRGLSTAVLLNAFPYGSGHCLVLPIRPVATLAELKTAESDELWAMINDTVAAIEAAYQPDGVNVGLNMGRGAGAGIPSHLHFHVLPRWSGDTNFMTTVAETRVLPESLPVTWAKVSGAWPDRSSGIGS